MLPETIIYEDNHLLIVEKEPGLLSQPDGTGRDDILSRAQNYLARDKPGRAYVGLVHRLDRAVGGVLALAKTSKGAARVSCEFRERRAKKIYAALVLGRPEAEEGRLENFLLREGDKTRKAGPGEQGKLASLSFRVRRLFPGHALLEIVLETGFKHQIRAQMAGLGCPVAGDFKYGGGRGEGPGIGLWAESLAFAHPTKKEMTTFRSRPPLNIWPWNLTAMATE